MNFTDIITAGIGTLVRDIGETVRSFVTTDKDRLEAQQKLTETIFAFQAQLVQSADNYEKELTERQKNDMASDSWLSKNIRPLTVVYLLACFTVLAFNDGNLTLGERTFTVAAAYVTAIQTFLEYGLMFYFGGRSLEKIAAMVSTSVSKRN
jgi:hypothetical protein